MSMLTPLQWFDLARFTADRYSTCVRRKVGAVLVSHRGSPLMVAWNTESLPNQRCDQGHCPRGRLSMDQLAPYAGGYDNCIATHAEVMALRPIIELGFSVDGYELFVTDKPCDDCASYIKEHAIGLQVWWPGARRVIEDLH